MGVTRTGTTTISTVAVGGEADYTYNSRQGNGITTTITNAPAPSNSKANVGSDYTTTVVSNGHTFTDVVSHITTKDSDGKPF
ncbi:hypothetical protein AB675_10180 [Cyphellophora attinorum]|uniref:Uncharacterized protein n=1 Tax=Cyphellophora attinorum TaxID=1664694 RepID=A0A0N0NH49_9EURO|nr:hypothetical protein AB675_10180 [Phialophora attinorum]